MNDLDRSGTPTLPVDAALLERAIDAAIGRYIAARRARIRAFVDETFRFRAALRLHRRAGGWDMVRAPANLLLAGPHLILKVSAELARISGARGLARWLDGRQLFLPSDVAREIEWRLFTRFLELPCIQTVGGMRRRYHRDALAEEILRDPAVEAAVRDALVAIGRRADDPSFRDWLVRAMGAYASTRVAAGDLANALLTAGIGALVFKQMTPGMLTLGPAVAQALAYHAAVSAFPLGTWIGGLWYGIVPISASVPLIAGVTGGLMALSAVLAAFSGVLIDPLQRRLGLHRRRLERLLDALETELRRSGTGRFAVRDHYVARILDILDILRAAQRLAG